MNDDATARTRDTDDASEPGRDGSERDVQSIAEETSRRIQPDDPMTEPPNSTVDDWLGQQVERDAQRLEDAPGAGVDDDTSESVPEPNEPA